VKLKEEAQPTGAASANVRLVSQFAGKDWFPAGWLSLGWAGLANGGGRK